MGGGEGDVKWYRQPKTFVMVATVLAAALSLPHFRRLNEEFSDAPPALLALAAGAFVSLLSYPPLLYAEADEDRKFALSSAVQLGLIVAKFCVYGAPQELPLPVTIFFFLFMYTYGYDKRNHYWPDKTHHE